MTSEREIGPIVRTENGNEFCTGYVNNRFIGNMYVQKTICFMFATFEEGLMNPFKILVLKGGRCHFMACDLRRRRQLFCKHSFDNCKSTKYVLSSIFL